MDNFNCVFCCVDFPDRESLNNHIANDHSVSLCAEPNESFDKENSGDLDSKPSINSDDYLSSVLSGLSMPDNPLSDIQLTDKLVLEKTGKESLNEIKLLELSNVGLTDFRATDEFSLLQLTNLEHLVLSNNYLKDLSGIACCKQVTFLELQNNLVENLSPLKVLVNLTELNLANNKVHEIFPLGNLQNLQVLNLSRNSLYNMKNTLSTLKSMFKLTHLAMEGNPCISKTPDAKNILISNLKLETLDGEDVSQIIMSTIRYDMPTLKNVNPLVTIHKQFDSALTKPYLTLSSRLDLARKEFPEELTKP